MTEVACPRCGATTHQNRKGLSRNGLTRYRCLVCGRQYTPGVIKPERPKIDPEDRIRLCVVCGRETTNPKFCSRSCSAIYNNHAAPKRTKQQRFCKHCGREIEGRATVCADCRKPSGGNGFDWSGLTLGDVKAKYPRHMVSNILGALARRFYRESERPKCCQRCGYSRFYEVCHIQAISSFPDETPVLVISALDNLMALCPNCHWEFDHGLLSIEDISLSRDAAG